MMIRKVTLPFIFILASLCFGDSLFTQATAEDTIKSPSVAESKEITVASNVKTDTASSKSSPIDTVKDSSVISGSDTKKVSTEEPIIEEEEISLTDDDNRSYRSPRKAMFYSLILPGLGQIYANSKIKGTVFLAIEAVCFGTKYYFNKSGIDKENDFHKYVDNHFSNTRYENWYKWVDEDYQINNQMLDFLHHEEYESSKGNRTHDYYEITAKSYQFVQGWDDCTPKMSDYQTENIPDSVGGLPVIEKYNDFSIIVPHEQLIQDTIFGYSENQIKARKIKVSANGEYDKAESVWFAILANHVCSSIDAALSARRYNRTSLNRKISFIDKIRIKNTIVAGAYSPVNVISLQVNF